MAPGGSRDTDGGCWAAEIVRWRKWCMLSDSEKDGGGCQIVMGEVVVVTSDGGCWATKETMDWLLAVTVEGVRLPR